MNIYSFQHQLARWLHKQPQGSNSGKPSNGKAKKPQNNQRIAQCWQKAKPPVMLVLTAVSLTSVLGNRFYNQPKLDEGKTAPRTYVAPQYLAIVDVEETEKQRKQARDAIFPVLSKNVEITAEIKTNIQNYLHEINRARSLVGRFPYIKDTEILSLASQIYLREVPEAEWQTILQEVENPSTTKTMDLNSKVKNQEDLNLEKEQVIAKLQYYRKSTNESNYQAVISQIVRARKNYSRAWEAFNHNATLSLNDQQKKLVLELSDEIWEKTDKLIREATHKILTQGMPQGISQSLLEETINLHLEIREDISETPASEADLAEEAKLLAQTILLKFIQPNLMVDDKETSKRAEMAAEAVEEKVLYIAKEQIIIEKGETITREQFLWLDEFGLSRRGVNWQGLWKSIGIATSAVLILWVSQKRARLPFRCQDQILLGLLTLSTPLLNILQFPYSNLPAVGFLTSSFYGPTVAVTQVSINATLVLLADEAKEGQEWELLLVGTIGGLLAAVTAGKLRDRDKLAQLGVAIGFSQWFTYFIIKLILTASPASIWWTALQDGMYVGLFSGVGWSILALGLTPYLERLFDLLTPSRLAELSNTNQPLLKKLAEEAPGTWQHTLYVSSLAEAAGRRLNCNVELIRAGTLYHDIGKLHDPQGFVENQMGGPNKHDTLADPWLSVEIIKKHVSEGLVMARRHELPKAICDFIPQHQGTMLVSYFYFQAKKQAEASGKEPISEADFRYDGPIPQSREAGIMMLADGCEAALRSLDKASREQALAMISKILKSRWQDEQLIDSDLKYEELPVIAEVFVEVWQQSKHQRIAYPKAALEVSKRAPVPTIKENHSAAELGLTRENPDLG